MGVFKFTMFRWQYFTMIGNNCRGQTQEDAQSVIDNCAAGPQDEDQFWTAYNHGRGDSICLPA